MFQGKPARQLAAPTAIMALIMALAIPVTPAIAQMSPRLLNAPTPAAGAAETVIGEVGRVAALMAAAGYPTERSPGGDGTPRLDGRLDGWGYSVYFYGCDGDICDAIQFAAGFDLDQPMAHDQINEWNRANRFGRAYLDDEGDPWVEMDVNMEAGGVTLGNFNETLGYWATVLPAFVNHIGW